MKITRWIATAGLALGLGIIGSSPAMAAFRHHALPTPAAVVVTHASAPAPATTCLDFLPSVPPGVPCPPPIIIVPIIP